MDMIALGAMSALSLGSADFIARFTSRRFGAIRSLLGVLVLSTTGLVAYLTATGWGANWPLEHAWLIACYGVATAVATLLLYQALALGPVTVAAPIVAAHPALIVAVATMLGQPSTAVQWAAIAATIGGAVVVARFSPEESDGKSAAPVRRTIAVAAAACICYAALVVFGQMAVRIYGDLQTVGAGRIVALVTLLPFLLLGTRRPEANGPAGCIILCLLALQGVLDLGGHLFLFAGSLGSQPHIVAVVASCFGAITTLLGWLILRERVSQPQWGGIALVFAGVAALTAATPH